MPYIKLLTVLAGLALLTACGGSATPKTDDTGGDTTTDCETNAFHADCNADAPAIELRQTMCLADSTTDDSCGAIITSFCTENPHRTFAGVCTGDTYLPNRIADCIEGGKADTPNCMTITTDTTKNTTLTACLTNPFDVACESVPDFMSSFAEARTNRASFCDNSANVDNDLCKGDNVTPICRFDPFTAICPDATYGTTRQTMCLANTAIDPTCVGAEGIATVFCGANLFSTETACMHTDYDDDRQMACLLSLDANDKCIGEMGIATVFCKANPFDTSAGCTEHPKILGFQVASCFDANNNSKHSTCPALVLVNHADYLASFGDTPPPATVALAIANTDTQSHFLSVDEEDGIDKTELTGNLTDNTLRLGGVDTDTEDTNGVAYVLGVIEGTAQSFVGLLPTTNLGAPLPSTTADATWAGRYYHGANREIHDIDFNIDFGTGEIEATDIQGNITTKFDLDFTAEGVITGDVIINPDTEPDTAEARGLIGEQGLVGGFANTDDVGIWGANFFGGFVAVPPNPCIALGTCVDTADWLASLTPTPPDLPETPRKNQFLKGTSTGFADRANLNIRDVDGLPLVVTTIQTIPFANTDTAAGGAAFFGGELYNGDNASGNDFYYAGVLAGTNVGAPITEIITAEANIRWTGEIRGNATNSSAKFTDGEIANFGLNITFDGNDGGTLKSFFAADTVLHFAIDGTFNANGIITGKVELGNRMGTTSTIRNNNIYSPGTLSGIIGQDGVVGVYYSNNNNAASLDGYSGGFVARPTPSE